MASIESQLLEIVEERNREGVKLFIQNNINDSKVIQFLWRAFNHTIQYGNSQLDLPTITLLISQSSDAVLRMQADVRKAKSEQDRKFVTYFDQVLKNQ